MSEKNDNDPVNEKLCEARRQTIQEQISGLKKTIIASSTTATIIIVFVQLVLTLR